MVRPRIVLNVTLASTRVLLVPSCAIVIGAIVVGACARSSTYPDPAREVRHIIPWGPGGATDVAMRGIAQYLEASLGIPVVTENVAGGLSAVGLLHVKGAPPDGYTIGTMTYNVLTLEFQGLAPVSWRDFEPIGMATDHATVLIGPAGRWTGVQAFEASAKAEPGSIKVGNVGTGGIWHQHAVAMERALGVTLAHVPYEAGSGAQIAALLGGEVDASVTSLPAAVPHLGAGALAALGVMSLDRDQLVPDVATFRELGYDLVLGGFRVIVAPLGTPEPILARLKRSLEQATNDPAFQAWADAAALGAHWRDRHQTRAYLEALAAKVERLINELDLTR